MSWLIINHHTESAGVESEAEPVLEVEDVVVNSRAVLHHQLDQLVCPVPAHHHHHHHPHHHHHHLSSPKLDVRVEVDELLEVVLRDFLPEVELPGLPEDRK